MRRRSCWYWWVSLVVVLAVVAYYCMYVRTVRLVHAGWEYYKVASCLNLFIEKHGRFPVSKEDLLATGLLRVEENSESYIVTARRGDVYHARFPDHFARTGQSEMTAYCFDDLRIYYGIDIEGVEVVRGGLRDEKTGQRVLLLSSERRDFRTVDQTRISIMLYQSILEHREKQQESRE